jgi:hypothetical protein
MKHALDPQQLAETIATHGVAAVEPSTVDAFGIHASRVGANAVLIDVFTDDAAPAPARVRAFGRLTAQVSRNQASQFVVAA